MTEQLSLTRVRIGCNVTVDGRRYEGFAALYVLDEHYWFGSIQTTFTNFTKFMPFEIAFDDGREGTAVMLYSRTRYSKDVGSNITLRFAGCDRLR